MCVVAAPVGCGCIGHTWPGVSHLVACCDVPHIDFGRGETWPVSGEAPSGPAEVTPASLA